MFAQLVGVAVAEWLACSQWEVCCQFEMSSLFGVCRNAPLAITDLAPAPTWASASSATATGIPMTATSSLENAL